MAYNRSDWQVRGDVVDVSHDLLDHQYGEHHDGRDVHPFEKDGAGPQHSVAGKPGYRLCNLYSIVCLSTIEQLFFVSN